MRVLKMRKRQQQIVSLLYLSDPLASAAIIAPDAICFGNVSQFNAIEERFLTSGTFILYSDEPVKPLPPDVTVIAFTSRVEQRECYNVLASELRAVRRMKDRIFELTSLVSRGSGIKALIDRISDIFGAPANVLDNSLCIVACSDGFPSYITDGKAGENLFLSETAQAALKAEGLVTRQTPLSPKVFSWVDESGLVSYNHYTATGIGDTVIGSISLFTQNEPMRKSRVDLLPEVARILSIELQKSSTYLMNKSVYYSHLFTDLINGSINETPDAIRYRFSMFGYSLRPFKRLVFADLSEEYLDSSQIQALAEQLHQVLDNNVYVVTAQGIILMTSRNTYIEDGVYRTDRTKADPISAGFEAAPTLNGESSEEPLPDRLDLCELAEVVRGTAVKLGISSIFTNVLHLPSYLGQAQRAISVGRRFDPAGPLYFYASYRPADILSHVENQNALYSLRYPPLMHVIREDILHGTNLAFTLFVYLQDPSHPANVCERLFIHKNTLYYRLDRIRTLMGVDIKNGWVITQIEMTFLILKQQGKFEELVLPHNDKGSDQEDPAHPSGKKRRGRRAKALDSLPPKPHPVVNKIVEFDGEQKKERRPAHVPQHGVVPLQGDEGDAEEASA